MEGVFLVANHHGVPGVVTAVELHHVVNASPELIGCLPLAFVAPLGSDDHDCWHDLLLLFGSGGTRHNTPRQEGEGFWI